MLTVDARGLSCPEPIIRTKNALQQVKTGEQVEVLVDTATARENVRRMAEAKKNTVVVEETEDGFRLVITRQAS